MPALLEPVDQLLDKIVKEDRGVWPPKSEAEAIRKVRTGRAFLETDGDALAAAVKWPDDRDYKVDGLAALIADCWADHIFDEDLIVKPAKKQDEELMAAMIAGSGAFDSDLREAAREVVAEGERWWRVCRDTEVSDYPILEWFGRDEVFPLFIGRRLMAVALVTKLDRPKGAKRNSVWRHFEIHTDGSVEHVLFVGTKSRIGSTVPMEEHPELEDLAQILGAQGGEGQVWDHGIGWLMGRVTNARGFHKNLRLARSEFERIHDQLLDLNEAATIGAENARLTAKRRVVVPESAVTTQTTELEDDGQGGFTRTTSTKFDAGEDLLVQSQVDAELGSDPASLFKVLEYSFDAEALIAYKRDLVETGLTRINITPQYAGVVGGEGGVALTGTALRIRLIPTTKGGKGKGRVWDDSLPHILGAMQRLSDLDEDEGGFGQPWVAADMLPTVERPSGLPSDEVEDAQVIQTLVGSRVMSRRSAIEERHPDWPPDRVDKELGYIDEDIQKSSAGGLIPGLA